MPAQRLAMRQVYEVLRLKWGQGLSERKIAQSLGISRPPVAEYVRRAQAAGLSWPLPTTYDAGVLERLLFPSVPARSPATHVVPDWATVHGLTALYLRLPRFLPELAIAKGDGRYGKMLTTLAQTDLLMLDDWGLAPLNDENRRDLLEIIEDRHDCRATLVTSQLPVEHWHEALGDPTLADAILDRLVHNAYKITLQGESMRKRQARLTRGATTE